MSIRITLCPICGKQTGMYESGRGDSIAASKCECRPTDPTPTPTPREVLARTLARCREYGGTGLDEWLPRVVEAARADERAALAATLVPERLEKLRHIFETHRDVHPVNSTEQLVAVYALEVLTAYTALVASGGEPLTAERVAELLLFEDECDGSDDRFAQRVYSALRDYRDAYTALAADLAALRAERDALRGQVDEWDSVREEVRFLADAVEANSVVEAYERDGVDFKDIEGHLVRDRKVVAAVRAVLARTGSPTPARSTDTPTEDQ